MIRLEVLDAAGTAVAAVDAPAGERLVDALDDARAPVAFGCRSATCGICQLEIVEGAERLAPPDPVERIALAELGVPEGDRLACRAVVSADGGPAEGAAAVGGEATRALVRVRPRTPRP